jgi:hypothetical protein
MHHGIEEEAVAGAVGRDVDVADEAVALVRPQMEEADPPVGQRSLPRVAPGGLPERAILLAFRIGIDPDDAVQSLLLNMTFASPGA